MQKLIEPSSANVLVPPSAERRPHFVEIIEHGAKIEDHFFYLRNKDDEQVLKTPFVLAQKLLKFRTRIFCGLLF
jgi:hypothetical protein